MRGIVFSEYIEFVEDSFSPDLADRMIEESHLPSGGAYTAVGTYDHQEMLTLVTTLGRLTGQPVVELVRTFGRHLFGRLAAAYPMFLEGAGNSLDFLKGIEDHIHREVLKLYPDAELPHFEWRQPNEDTLELIYRSRRPLADLAEGLLQGTAAHFDEQIGIAREDLAGGDETRVRFTLTKMPGA